jgi:hypothetical protein
MVSTLDFESSDPSSNLGGTSIFSFLSEMVFFVLFITLVSVFNSAKSDFNVIIDASKCIKELKPIWTSTGFSPEISAHTKKPSILVDQKDVLLNIALIGSLPNGAINQVRIHWLLDLMESEYDLNTLDQIIQHLWSHDLKPGFEMMGNPGNKFNNFTGENYDLTFLIGLYKKNTIYHNFRPLFM